MLAGHTGKNGSVEVLDAVESDNFRDAASDAFEDICFFGFSAPTLWIKENSRYQPVQMQHSLAKI